MGLSTLGPRKLRLISRAIGQQVLRGWSNGGYDLGFVTLNHRHGWFNTTSHEWGFDDEYDWHPMSCHLLFPNTTDPLQLEAAAMRRDIAAAVLSR